MRINISDAYRFFVSFFKMNYSYAMSEFEKYQFRRSNRNLGRRYFPCADEVLARPYLFVLSTGRCGTGLITELFCHSTKLRVEHNPKPELEYASSIVHRDNVNEDALIVAVLAARFDLFFLDTFLRGKMYVETNNRISFFAPALAKLLPNAKFVHLVRDPADFVRSGMCRGYYEQGVVQHQRLDGAGYAPWNNFSRLEKIAWEWNEINRKIEDFKSHADVDRVLTMNSESLYKDPQSTMHLFEFLQIENPFEGKKGLRSLKKLLSNPVNKQKAGYFPKYKDWNDSDKQAFLRIVTLAPMYGYSYE